MANKKTSTPTPPVESILEQVKTWLESDRDNQSIVLLRNRRKGVVNPCIYPCNDLALVELLVIHMMHNEGFREAVSAANYLIENERDQIEDYIKQHQSQSYQPSWK